MALAISNIFTAGQKAKADEVNQNFQEIVDYLNALDTTDVVVPSGTIVAYGGATPPTGWLLCNGAAVSRTTFAALFAVILGTYGNGNGSTTFNLPDLRGRLAPGEGTAADMQRGNSEDLAVGSRAVGHTHSRGSIAGTTSVPIGTATAFAGSDIGVATNVHGHTISVSGDTGANGPAYQVVNYIIKI